MKSKWGWKMDWCKKQGYPPAQHWAWMLAEEAWKKHIKNND